MDNYSSIQSNFYWVQFRSLSISVCVVPTMRQCDCATKTVVIDWIGCVVSGDVGECVFFGWPLVLLVSKWLNGVANLVQTEKSGRVLDLSMKLWPRILGLQSMNQGCWRSRNVTSSYTRISHKNISTTTKSNAMTLVSENFSTHLYWRFGIQSGHSSLPCPSPHDAQALHYFWLSLGTKHLCFVFLNTWLTLKVYKIYLDKIRKWLVTLGIKQNLNASPLCGRC